MEEIAMKLAEDLRDLAGQAEGEDGDGQILACALDSLYDTYQQYVWKTENYI